MREASVMMVENVAETGGKTSSSSVMTLIRMVLSSIDKFK